MATAYPKHRIIHDTKVTVTVRGTSFKVDFYYTDHQGVRQRLPKSFKTEADCWAHAERTLADARDKIDSRKPENTTVDMLGRLYIEERLKLKGSSPSTLHNVDLAFRSLSRYIGRITMAELTKQDVNRVRAALLDKGLKISTVRNYLTALRSAIRWGIEEDYVRTNVAVRSPLPEVSKADRARARQDMYVPSLNEMARIIEAQAIVPGTDERELNQIICLFLADTGCRITECLKLEERHINTENPDRMFMEVGVKNTTSYRRIPLEVDLLMEILRLKDRWREVEEAGTLHTYVFVQKNGKRPDGDTVRRRMAKVGRELHLRENLHPHLFRHYCASRMLAAGLTLEDVKMQLGHANIGITSDLYAHWDLSDRSPRIFAANQALRDLRKRNREAREAVEEAEEQVALQPPEEPVQ